jgi:branched-chain amino acid transport system permease protein
MNWLPGNSARDLSVLGVLLVVAPLPILGSSYYEGVLAHFVIFAMLAVALNIVFGETDQLFLFMGGLAGIGAYGTALLTDWLGVTAWLTLPVAALFAGLVGLSVSWISAKRKFTVVLISILTLNLQFVISEVLVGAREYTGGSTGFSYQYFSMDAIAETVGVNETLVLYYLMVLLLLALLVAYVALVNSRYGVAFNAIRQDELAAASIGVDVVHYKVFAGFLSAFMFGVIGAFYALEAGYVLPSAFSFQTVDVLVLIILIVGGLRSTLGPVVGAGIIVAIEEMLGSTFTNWRTAIFGALLIIIFLYFRSGVIPAVDNLRSGRFGRRFGGAEEEPEDEPAD